MGYIYQNPDWHNFTWREETILPLLSKVKLAQHSLLEEIKSSDFEEKNKALANILSEKIIKAAELKGESIDQKNIRSFVAQRLCIDLGAKSPPDRNAEGITMMTIDATQNFDKKISKERFVAWHSKLFPTGLSGMNKITMGQYRRCEKRPMRIISDINGSETIHYEAPAADSLEGEMNDLIDYINGNDGADYLIKAGIVHLWFVALHPFSDGNGRIVRALTDMMLAKSDNLNYRFYTMSSQIIKEREDYNNILDQTVTGTMDITDWLIWFLENLLIAIETSDERQKKS